MAAPTTLMRGEVERQLCVAVAGILGAGRVVGSLAPRAQLRRLGFGIPDFEALEAFVADTWDVPVTVHTDCTITAVADAVCEAHTRRNAA